MLRRKASRYFGGSISVRNVVKLLPRVRAESRRHASLLASTALPLGPRACFFMSDTDREPWDWPDVDRVIDEVASDVARRSRVEIGANTDKMPLFLETKTKADADAVEAIYLADGDEFVVEYPGVRFPASRVRRGGHDVGTVGALDRRGQSGQLRRRRVGPRVPGVFGCRDVRAPRCTCSPNGYTRCRELPRRWRLLRGTVSRAHQLPY